MTLYAAQSDKVPAALSRTWEATVTYRECGVVTDVRTYAVTISNFDGYAAEVDGQPADVLDAARILKNAESNNGLTLTREVLPTPAGMLAHARAAWARA